MAIASNGYVFVPHAVDHETLEALRTEADSLFSLKRSEEDALTEDEYFDKGCALDFFSGNELPEDDGARLSMVEYMTRRNGNRSPRPRRHRHRHPGDRKDGHEAEPQLPASSALPASRDAADAGGGINATSDSCSSGGGGGGSLSPAPPTSERPARPMSPCCAAREADSCTPATASAAPSKDDVDGRAGDDGATDHDRQSWTNGHLNAVRDAIFGTLAGFALDALRAECSAASAPTDAAADSSTAAAAASSSPAPAAGRELLLFNEQYVVKPPRSSIEFGWHTDAREQLAMCVFAPGARPPVYVSVWLALDDCDAANGCLEVYPHAWNEPRLQAPAEKDDVEVVCLPASAGDAVVFSSNLWHRSGPNRIGHPRRAFYAQYSLDVIRAAPSDPRPLSLAVPCLLSRGQHRSGGGGGEGGGEGSGGIDPEINGLARAAGAGRRSSGDRRDDETRRPFHGGDGVADGVGGSGAGAGAGAGAGDGSDDGGCGDQGGGSLGGAGAGAGDVRQQPGSRTASPLRASSSPSTTMLGDEVRAPALADSGVPIVLSSEDMLVAPEVVVTASAACVSAAMPSPDVLPPKRRPEDAERSHGGVAAVVGSMTKRVRGESRCG